MSNATELSVAIIGLGHIGQVVTTNLTCGMGDFEKKTTDKAKANVTKLVWAGYDFVIDGIKKMTPAQLNEPIKVFGRFDMSRAMALAKDFEHQTHQRGQTTVYIRLSGLTPPREKLI